ILELKRLGVKDSKKLDDNKIIELAKVIKAKTVNASVILSNDKFNSIMNQPNMNMNKIKAILHNKALSNLLAKGINPDAIVIDGFTTQDKYFAYLADKDDVVKENVRVIEKAEDKYISVGAASILARAYFLKSFNELCEKYGYNLPKGAGPNVDKMIYTIITQGKKDILKDIAKVSFKNTYKIKND
ncbi:MAG: ribonuclease HIII, partial [Bacilli bacterium]|nr:ribonuclease HIII [Bacilli bacterium]